MSKVVLALASLFALLSSFGCSSMKSLGVGRNEESARAFLLEASPADRILKEHKGTVSSEKGKGFLFDSTVALVRDREKDLHSQKSYMPGSAYYDYYQGRVLVANEAIRSNELAETGNLQAQYQRRHQLATAADEKNVAAQLASDPLLRGEIKSLEKVVDYLQAHKASVESINVKETGPTLFPAAAPVTAQR